MRILIDECLDWRLCRALSEHDCASVHKMNWSGFSNGLLLQRAQEEFDVLLTSDANLSFQQNVTSFNIAVVILIAGSTRLTDTLKLMPAVLKLLSTIQPGEVVRVGLEN